MRYLLQKTVSSEEKMMFMRNRFLALFWAMAMLAFAIPSAAAPIKVKGSVTDEKGEPMMGAIIVAKANTKAQPRATVTADDKGRFVIDCETSDILVAYFLGYDDAVVPVESKGIIDIVMQPSSDTVLDEIVVVGYGSERKSDLTGSVANVNMGDIRSAAVTSIDQAMQGRIAGADIMSTSGDPDATTSIRIRGTRSITASNDPLIIVDGVMDAVSDLNDINPADIESISVLKDASSTAIYGARGSNGVILITTKEASPSSSVSITAKFTGGVSMLPEKLDLMNAAQFANYRNEYAQLSSTVKPDFTTESPVSQGTVGDPYGWGEGTDWIGEITRVAPYNAQQISGSCTVGSSKHYASFSHYDNRGIIKNSGVRNMVARVNSSVDLFKWLRVGTKISYTYRDTDNNLATIGGTNLWHSAIYLSPLMAPDAITNPLNTTGSKVTLPTREIAENTNNTIRSMLNLVGYADAKVTKRIKFHTQVSFYRFDRNKYQYYPSTLPSRMDGLGGKAAREYYTENKFNWDNTLTWNRTFAKKHSLKAMVGSAYYSMTSDYFSLSGQGYMNDDVKWNNMNAVQDKNTYSASTSKLDKQTLSFFARLNYDYKKRYYLTMTARGDGASNFAANNKWGFFPSAALRWNIHNEKFLKGVSKVDELSLKLSYGRTGNDAISAYRSLAAMTSTTGGYLFEGSQPVAYYPSRLASPDLRWEKTDLVNLALTGAFFNNRLNVTAEAYYAYTSDLLLNVQVATQTGYSSRLTNIGATSNKGIELSIESRNIVKRNFVWSTAFTISHNTQRVEDIGNENYITAYAAPTTDYLMYGYVKGYPLNALWGFQYAGVWHNAEEIERNKTTHAVASRNGTTTLGYPVYVDRNHDGVLDNQDLTYLGNADPVVYGGLQNTFRFGKLSLGVYFVYSLGGKIFNYSELYMSGSRSTNQYAYMVNAWHPIKNPDSNYPRAGIMDGDVHSTRQLHDASYLRLKTVNISYVLNLRKKIIRDITFSISGENLFLWKYYNGFDPDVSTSSDGSTIRRMDLGAYPRARTIMASIQLRY